MTGVYDLQLVALSLVVAIIASYTALELAGRAGARTEVARQAWELYGEASRAGFGQLDSSGLLNLLEPSPGPEPA